MALACDVPFGSLRVAPKDFPEPERDLAPDASASVLVLAGGCFWCVEAVFREVMGVTAVRSGYAGGTAASANYNAVCGGNTGHAEVIEVRYDPAQTSFGRLLKIFFSVAHDPTQLDRQGNDRGTQYRSAIFYADEAQRQVAEAYIRLLNERQVFKTPVVTRLEKLEAFYPAEGYHQDYAARNPGQPYIQMVSLPKVDKLRAIYPEQLKR